MRTSDKSTHLAIRRRATRPEDQTLTANLSGCDVVRLNGVLLSDDCCYTSVTEMLLNECFATQLTFRRISGPIINVCPHEGGLTVIGRARQCSHILKKKVSLKNSGLRPQLGLSLLRRAWLEGRLQSSTVQNCWEIHLPKMFLVPIEWKNKCLRWLAVLLLPCWWVEMKV